MHLSAAGRGSPGEDRQHGEDNHRPPADDHDTTFPSVSVRVITVLLNDAWTWAIPWWMMRFSPRFLNVFFAGRFPVDSGFCPAASVGSVLAMNYTVFFLATAPRRGPFRVRAFVFVR